MLSEWIAFDADAATGIERLRARFTRYAYDRHAHETYAIGMTEEGSQTYTCRGESHTTRPGAIILFNPTEMHDGHATTADGFTYRMLHIDTATIRGLLAGEAGNPEPLFDRPLALDPTTARLIARAYDALTPETPTLARDDALLRLLLRLARRYGGISPRLPAAGRTAQSSPSETACATRPRMTSRLRAWPISPA